MPDFGRWTSNGGDPSLNEINRADRFFEALAAKQPVYATDPAEAELSFLLSGFRDDVRDAPITAPVGMGDAVRALEAGRARSRGSRRSFAVVGSVAAAVLCIGGFGTAVYGAGPGDSLYGMRSALFGTREATRNEQVSLASAQLQQVQQLIDNGQWQEAQDKLVAVSNTVQTVDAPTESKQQLVEQWNALTYKVVEQDPAATLPQGQPLPVLPSSPLTWLPVPVVEPSATSSSTSTSASESTTSSDSAVTSTTGSSVPPEGPSSTPSDSTSPTSPSSSGVSSSPSTSPVPVVPPSPATTSATPPSTPATTTTTTSSVTTTTTTTTVPTREPEATQQTPASPASEAPAPQPRVVSSASGVPPAEASTPALAPSVAVQPTQAVAPTPPAERPSVAPTTTTILPSGG